MTPQEGLPLRIRPATNEDIGFIFNSWMRSYRDKGTGCKNVPTVIYDQNQHKLIERLLQNATTLIACNDEDPSQIFGYICAEYIQGAFVVHYAYTKHSMRKFGVFSHLLNAFQHDATVAGCYTHQTSVAYRLENKYQLIYHPYLLVIDYGVKKDEKPKAKTPRKRKSRASTGDGAQPEQASDNN